MMESMYWMPNLIRNRQINYSLRKVCDVVPRSRRLQHPGWLELETGRGNSADSEMDLSCRFAEERLNLTKPIDHRNTLSILKM